MIMFELLSLARALLAEQGEEDQAEQWYRKAGDAGRRVNDGQLGLAPAS
jgi:hypothetical protein